MAEVKDNRKHTL